MSGLAQILMHRGEQVTGSDRQDSEDIERLRAAGAEVVIGHAAENIQSPDLVVYTAAISRDNPELLAARKKNIPTIVRADFLGELMRDFTCPIGISGTHGKTTTTGMLGCVFNESGLDPTIMIGGNLPQIGGNIQIGSDAVLVFEACEYVDSFLSFNPKMAVITNIEADHLDYFDSISEIRDSFVKFLQKLPDDGTAIVNKDNKNAVIVSNKTDCRKIYYSVQNPSADYYASDIHYNEGKPTFSICSDGETLANITLNVRGEHNVSNALAAFAVASEFGMNHDAIAKGLETFTGTGRRFESHGEVRGIRLFDDYAHHPTEIKTTFASAEALERTGKIWYVFQPHTYSRTKALKEEFIEVLYGRENVIIADIYAARENPIKDITSQNLARDCGATYIDGDLGDIADFLAENAKSGDIIVTLGAGDVHKIIGFLKE